MPFPPSTIAADKANNTAIADDHPDHHNELATAINDTVSEIQTWTVDRAAAGNELHNLGAISVGHNGLSSGTKLVELGGSTTVTDGGSAVMMEFGEYEATYTTTNGGAFIGIHITPSVLGSASVAEIVGIQSQVSSITDVTSQIHAIEALVNFGTIGKTAALSRCLWAQTVAAFGTITEGIGIDVNGSSSGVGTITTMYGIRIGRTSGSLALQGTTKYGVYVNQGSVRNYFGGDTQFGGGSNGTWDSYVLNVDSGGASLVGLLDITGSSAQLVIGASSLTSANIAAEVKRTEGSLGNVSKTGLFVNDSMTWTSTGGSSAYTGISVGGSVSVGTSQTVASAIGVLAQPSSTGAGTTTALTALKANAQGGGTVTTAIAVDAQVNQQLGTATTAVGVDITMPSQVLGTITTGIGLRIASLAEPTTKWAMQIADLQSYHHGRLSLGGTTAPTYGLDILGTDADRGVIRLAESTATPTNPSSSTGVLVYHKADKIVFAFNDAGTMRYKYLDMTGTGVTWTHNTTAP